MLYGCDVALRNKRCNKIRRHKAVGNTMFVPKRNPFVLASFHDCATLFGPNGLDNEK
jgi:hypothetical protein